MSLASVFEMLAMLVLAATLPVTFIAIRGFEDAPFVRVLRPMPVVFIGYIVYIGPQYLDLGLPLMFYAVVSTIGVLASLAAAAEATLLLTGRRAV